MVSLVLGQFVPLDLTHTPAGKSFLFESQSPAAEKGVRRATDIDVTYVLVQWIHTHFGVGILFRPVLQKAPNDFAQRFLLGSGQFRDFTAGIGHRFNRWGGGDGGVRASGS